MHIGKSYRLFEFLYWTRRSIFWLLLISSLPTILYFGFEMKWLSVPWPVIALLGSATAFIVGFKNVQTYNRTWEARQIWGAAISSSWSWTWMSKDFVEDPIRARELIYRHLAWLTALRYQLRVSKNWETTDKPHNREYMRYYSIPEHEIPLEKELIKYISKVELDHVISKKNKALQLLRKQSQAIQGLFKDGLIDNFQYVAMHTLLQEISGHQGKCERIKNFPYPRQYATLNNYLVKLFCILLPFSMLSEFEKLNPNMVWLVIPFSVLISWIYTTLEQVGESTENPFEGSPNDVSISQLSRSVEIDIREMLGETDLPPILQPQNNIIL